jgi:glucan phosphorylase
MAMSKKSRLKDKDDALPALKPAVLDHLSYSQDKVTAVWKDQEHWTRMSILNTARAGKFSSDCAIREYCDEIWKVKPVSVELHTNLRDL